MSIKPTYTIYCQYAWAHRFQPLSETAFDACVTVGVSTTLPRFDYWTRGIVGVYHTNSGLDGCVITKDKGGTYSYTGKWGAGSGHTREAMESFLSTMLRLHPRHSISLQFFNNVRVQA